MQLTIGSITPEERQQAWVLLACDDHELTEIMATSVCSCALRTTFIESDGRRGSMSMVALNVSVKSVVEATEAIIEAFAPKEAE